MPVKRGSCLCREIQYSVTGEPFDFNVCHCLNCQKCTGSAFSSNTFFKPEQVKVTKGKLTEFIDRDTKSGVPITRKFCPTCGANVFVIGGEGKFIMVDVGTLDDKITWLPKWEGFIERRREWVAGIKLEGQRK